MTTRVTTEQPAPVMNTRRPLWGLVVDDMRARDLEGRRRYGTPLQAGNGRDSLVDAYQEALDLVVYLRQVMAERDLAPAGAATAEWMARTRQLVVDLVALAGVEPCGDQEHAAAERVLERAQEWLGVS